MKHGSESLPEIEAAKDLAALSGKIKKKRVIGELTTSKSSHPKAERGGCVH